MPITQADPRIRVERPNGARLNSLKVTSWPIWTKELSTSATGSVDVGLLAAPLIWAIAFGVLIV